MILRKPLHGNDLLPRPRRFIVLTLNGRTLTSPHSAVGCTSIIPAPNSVVAGPEYPAFCAIDSLHLWTAVCTSLTCLNCSDSVQSSSAMPRVIDETAQYVQGRLIPSDP
jgi:hypothetical protein